MNFIFKIKNRNNKKEQRINNVLSSTYFFLLITNLSVILESMMGIPQPVISNAMKGLICAICILNVRILLQRYRHSMLIIPLSAIMIYVSGYLLFEETLPYLKNTVVYFLVLCMPLMLYCIVIRDYEQLRKSFVNVAYLETILSIFVVLLGHNAFASYFTGSSYAMGLGYAYVVPLLFLMHNYICEKKISSLVCGIILLLLVVMYGSRGPLLCILIFGLIFLFRYLAINKRYVALSAISIVMLVSVASFKDLVSILGNVLFRLGIESRSLKLLINNITFVSNRDIYYRAIIREIKLHPFYIRGINADYLLINDYSHNFILELLYEFGVILGGIVIFYIFWCVIKTVLSDYNKVENAVCLIFMCASIPSLLVSGTLWYSQAFWIWFIIYHCINRKKSASI